MWGRLNQILNLPAVVRLFDLVKVFRSPVSQKVGSHRNSTIISPNPDPGTLNCRVRLAARRKESLTFDVFNVEIRGRIRAPADMQYTVVRISITDVTDGPGKAMSVYSKVKKWQMNGSQDFVFTSELGKLPGEDTLLSDWTAIAQMNLDWLLFPHKGQRELQFITSILSRDSGEELACAIATFTYENCELGYMDLQQNIQHAKMLAVTLAFAVSASDNKLYGCEVEFIKNWARANFDDCKTSGRAGRKLEKALKKTVDFFRNGYKIDIHKICKELVDAVPPAQRYDILNLCMRVAHANGVAAEQEIALLKNIADWLEVDTDRFRAMMEKILPVGMHEVEDIEVVLGINPDMDEEQTRRHLNKEYRKWSARVTNLDPEIRTQADYMLKFIAEARNAYVKER
ncbi:MAG: TerB family tellurite resistance protein [Planctomycetota bacterium]|nr:MAG: TerB family tellurite resistance protein [Planctomycetota bacterium]